MHIHRARALSLTDRIFDEFPAKLAFTVLTLLTCVPWLHQYVGPYVKIALLWSLLVLAWQAVRRRLIPNSAGGRGSAVLLGCFAFLYGLTVLLNRSFYFSENAAQWLYMLVYFFVLFYCSPEKEEPLLRKEYRVLAAVVVAVTMAFSLLSLTTFLFQLDATYRTPLGIYRIGMFENRLWGLYNPNTGATLALISTAMTGLLLLHPPGRLTAAVLGVNAAVQYLCLVLTQSRTGLFTYALLVGGGLALCGNRLFRRTSRGRGTRRALTGAICLTAGAIVFFAAAPVKNGLAFLPPMLRLDGGDNAPLDLERLEDVEDRPGGLLTGRPELWIGAIRAFKKQPLLGVTRERLPDMVRPYVDSTWYGALQSGGVHNLYLTVLTCSGALGFLCIAAFFVLYLRRVLPGLLCACRGGDLLPCLVALLLFCLLTAELVETRLLYRVGFFGVWFWLSAGYLPRWTRRPPPAGNFVKKES